MGRQQLKGSDQDLASAAAEFLPGTGADLGPKAPDVHEQLPQLHQEQEGVAFATATEPAFVVAALPVPDSRRERTLQLLVPRAAIENLYGPVLLPHPVLLRYKIDGELEPQVRLRCASVCLLRLQFSSAWTFSSPFLRHSSYILLFCCSFKFS